MEIEIGMAIPNTKEEDPEIETDGKEGADIQDRNPKEDTESTEIVAETGETELLGNMKEKTKTDTTGIEREKKERIEIEEKERAQIEETGTETRKKEKTKR